VRLPGGIGLRPQPPANSCQASGLKNLATAEGNFS
jgi:hypothetical protein